MLDLDILRLMLCTIVGLGATYFLVPEGEPARAALDESPAPRDLMQEHLLDVHRHPVTDCPLCEFDVHGPAH